MKLTSAVENAYKAALMARAHSHSPYSRFKVGAALQIQGKTDSVGGCNVENASYGATICAERVALTRAVAEGRRGFVNDEYYRYGVICEALTFRRDSWDARDEKSDSSWRQGSKQFSSAELIADLQLRLIREARDGE